jgi:hypothetical protein
VEHRPLILFLSSHGVLARLTAGRFEAARFEAGRTDVADSRLDRLPET